MMTTRRAVEIVWLVGAVAAGAGGCASGEGSHGGGSDPSVVPLTGSALAPAPPNVPRERPIFEAASGSRLGWGELVSRVASADAVLIGEVHGDAVGGAVCVALAEDLLASGDGATSALALEFFDRDTQVAIDDYLGGLTDEAAFREATGRSEGNYPEAHRGMLEAYREAGLPVIAANAPRRYVTLARKDGMEAIDGLSPEQRRLVVTPSVAISEDYEDRFFDLMAGMMAQHVPEPERVDPGEGDDSEGRAQQRNIDRAAYSMIEGYFRSQSVWDATMADSVARAMDLGFGPVLLVVGQFHTDYEGGLAQRLAIRRPGARVLTISLVDEVSGELREEDADRADVVVYIGNPVRYVSP